MKDTAVGKVTFDVPHNTYPFGGIVEGVKPKPHGLYGDGGSEGPLHGGVHNW